MSFPYIHNLGITRLKEIGKILQIPRYTTYKDPEQLREYIQTFLTKKNQVTQVHLNKIQKTKEDIDRLTRHIAVVAAKYKNAKDDPVRSRPRSEVKELASNEMANLLQQLQNCQAQLEVPCIPPDLKEELSRHLQMSNDANVKDLIRALIDSDNESRQTIRALEENLFNEQNKAVASLRESQGRIERLSADNAILEKKISKLVQSIEDQKADKSLVTEIARLTDQLKVQTIELSGKIAELETSKAVIMDLQTRIGLDADRETKFSTELGTLRGAYEQLQQTNLEQADTIRRIEGENKECGISLAGKLEELVVCTNRTELCEKKIDDINTKMFEIANELRVCNMERNLLKSNARLTESMADAKIQEYSWNFDAERDKLVKAKKAIESARDEIQANYDSEVKKTLELNDVINQHGKTITEASLKLSKLQEQLDTCELNAKKYQDMHEKLEKEAQLCRKELAATQNNLRNKSGRALDILRKKVQQFAAAEKKCNLNIEQLEQSFAEQKKGDTEKFEQTLGKCTNDLDKFKRLHSQFVADYQNEERKNKECTSQLEAATGDMGRLNRQLTECQEKLLKTKEKLRATEADLVIANQKVADTNRQLADANRQLGNLMLQNRIV